MPDIDRDDDPANPATHQASGETPRRDEFDDEEKILEGRPDVNLPALLTKDVQGG